MSNKVRTFFWKVFSKFDNLFKLDETSSYASLPSPTPPKTLVSITFTKRDDQHEGLDLYDVRHNFSDGSSLLSIHAGNNFEGYRPPSNIVAILQDDQQVSSIPSSFLDWLNYSE